MKRIAIAIMALVLLGGCLAQASPVDVTKSIILGVEGFTITALEPNVSIKSVSVNRGSCQENDTLSGRNEVGPQIGEFSPLYNEDGGRTFWKLLPASWIAG